MKKVFLFMALILMIGSADAQVFSKKMKVGVKTYSFFDDASLYEVEFKDLKGSLDKYNFYHLDSAVGEKKLCLVYDRKSSWYRLPLTMNEAMGIADKEGDKPLERIYPKMGIISPAFREKIE